MKVLAFCGSLRQQSRSRALLQATHMLAPDHMEFSIFEGLGDLPLFNPDDEARAPRAVQSLWEAVSWADIVVIASPEYAHGVTGTIKNALDWLVGYTPFAGMPVAIFNPSHRANHADASLREILNTMAAQLIADACVSIPVTACELGPRELTKAEQFSRQIRSALAAMERFFENRPTP